MTDHRRTRPAPQGVRGLVCRIDGALPFTKVTTESTPATLWCADVIAHAGAGRDPLRPWCAALATRQEASDRPHIAVAFVLQWWCEVVATPIAYAAELGPGLVLPEGAGLGFELATAFYPHRIVIDPQRVRMGGAGRVEAGGKGTIESGGKGTTEAGRAAYDLLVSDVVAGFAPEVKMSSRQRWGVVEDVWAMTVRRGADAAGRPMGPEPRRVSCCFIYALPGMRECASCPRRDSRI